MKVFIFSFLILFTVQFVFAESTQGTSTKEVSKNFTFKLAGIKKGSIFDRLKLKNGDVIQKINGRPISGMNDVKNEMANFKTSDSVDFEIIRNGKIKTLHYDLK